MMSMNRTQRRAKMRAEKKGAGAEQRVTIPPVHIRYAHNGAHALLMFDRRTEAIAFTLEQADVHIAMVKQVRDALAAHPGKASHG